MTLRSAFLLAISLSTASCMAGSRTQIIVRVDSDMEVRAMGGINAIELVVRSQEGMERARYPVQLAIETMGPSRYFPLDLFSIEPLRGDTSRAVTVEATAIDGMNRLFTVRAVASFVPGRTSILELFLADQCRSRVDPCPADFSCGRAGSCVPDRRANLPLGGDAGLSSDVPSVSMSRDVPSATADAQSDVPVQSIDVVLPPPIDIPDPQNRCLGIGNIHGDGCCAPNTTWCQDNDCAQSRMVGDGCCSPALENACNDPSSCLVMPNDGCCATARGENCFNSFVDCRSEPACLCAIRCCDNTLQLSQQPNAQTCDSYAVRAGACPRLRVRYGDMLRFERSIACP